MVDTWMYLVVGFAAGVLVACLFASQIYKKSDTQVKYDELRSEHKNLQSEYLDYRKKVREHFVEAATVLDEVNESQRKLYTAMASGVTLLCRSEDGEVLEVLSPNIRELTDQMSESKWQEPVIPMSELGGTERETDKEI